jgi:prephenate dehydrogenase
MEPTFDAVAIVGPGLVGGSLGLALRRRGLARRVIGIGHRAESLDVAKRVGAVDETTLDAGQGVREADLVVIATPISAVGPVARAAAGRLKRGAVVTDVASVKQSVISTVREALAGRDDVAYVPTHPMAGSERRGAEHADAELFAGSVCIFTPLAGTPASAVHRLRAMWEAVGARVCTLEAETHDRIVARISHLPHLVAAALVLCVSEDEAAFSGGGLADTTRIAGGAPPLWRDICQSNAPEVLRALDDFAAGIGHVRDLIAQDRFDELQALLEAAKRKRDSFPERRRPR